MMGKGQLRNFSDPFLLYVQDNDPNSQSTSFWGRECDVLSCENMVFLVQILLWLNPEECKEQ